MKKAGETTIQLGCFTPIFFFSMLLLLKITGSVDWSWWVITLPIYLPAVLLLLYAVLGTIAIIIIQTITD